MRSKRTLARFLALIGTCLGVPLVVVTPIVGLMNPNVFAAVGLVQFVVVACATGLVARRII